MMSPLAYSEPVTRLLEATPEPARFAVRGLVRGNPAAGLEPAIAVPEPTGFVLFASGLAVALRTRRRR